jgi:hypothetical protein
MFDRRRKRLEHQAERGEEGHELADRLLAGDDLLAAEPEDGDEPSRRDQVHRGRVRGKPRLRPDRGPEKGFQLPLEPRVLGPFEPVELDRLDAVKDLVEPGGDARRGDPGS